MARNLSIRPASSGDADAVAALMSELGHPISTDQAYRFIIALPERPETTVLIAALGEQICGVAAGQLLTVISDAKPVLMITALSVSAASQRSGAGRALVSRLEAWGRESGAARVLVTTALHRDGAHAFYERMGYSFSGRRYGRSLEPGSSRAV